MTTTSVSKTPAQEDGTVTITGTTPVSPMIVPPDFSEKIKLLVYGLPGVGKTTLLTSAARCEPMRDILLIDAESGTTGIAREIRDLIDVVRIRRWEQFAKVLEMLRYHIRYRELGDDEKLAKLQETTTGVLPKNKDEIRRYNTVIIDSLSEVQKYVMYFLLGIDPDTQRLDWEIQVPEYKQWNQNAEGVRLMIRSFRNLPLHFLAAAGEQVEEDDRGRNLRLPSLPGKLAIEVQGFFDIVGWLMINQNQEGGKQRRLYLQPGSTYTAKNRFSEFKDDYLINTNMREIYDFSLVGK